MNGTTSFDADGRPDRTQPTPARPVTIRPEDEEEFRHALDAYKRSSGRQFPTWSEILEVLAGLGYAKRIWRPVEAPPSRATRPSAPPPAPIPSPHLDRFQPAGVDPDSGMLCWFSRVETPGVY